MNKMDMLVKLKDYIEEEGVIQNNYCKDGKYCSVGYLMHLTGIEDDFLEEIESTILDISKKTDGLDLVLEKGFTTFELEILMAMNDENSLEELYEYVERMIEGVN